MLVMCGLFIAIMVTWAGAGAAGVWQAAGATVGLEALMLGAGLALCPTLRRELLHAARTAWGARGIVAGVRVP